MLATDFRRQSICRASRSRRSTRDHGPCSVDWDAVVRVYGRTDCGRQRRRYISEQWFICVAGTPHKDRCEVYRRWIRRRYKPPVALTSPHQAPIGDDESSIADIRSRWTSFERRDCTRSREPGQKRAPTSTDARLARSKLAYGLMISIRRALGRAD